MPTRYVPSVSIEALGATGGGGAVTTTVFVTSMVDVIVAIVVDPPQPTRTIAAPAMAAFLPVIVRRVSSGVSV